MTRPLLIIVFLVLVSLILPFSVRADCSNPLSLGCAIEGLSSVLNGSGETNGNFSTASFDNTSMLNSTCQLINPTECKEAGYITEGTVQNVLNNGIVALYRHPVADPAMYIADVGSRFGFVPPVYAQNQLGIGFSGLSPLLPMWKGFRNIAYAFLIIIMVTIGFMIMLRHRLDPRTVVTVQNALPGVIVALILVTFSYAIAGLMIDLMYLIIGIGYVAMEATVEDLNIISGSGFPSIASKMMGMGFETLNDVYGFFGTPLGIDTGNQTANTGLAGTVASIIGVVVGFGASNPLAGFLTAGVFVLPALIVALAVVFAMLRVYFMLISAYIQILISVMFGPIQIMLGAIPGSSGFGSWARGLAANLSVFVVTAIMLVIGMILGNQSVNPAFNNNEILWTPPGIAYNTGETLAGMLGLGIMLVIPSIAAGVKELFKTKPIAPVSGSTFLSPIASLTGGIQQGFGMMSQWRMFKSRP